MRDFFFFFFGLVFVGSRLLLPMKKNEENWMLYLVEWLALVDEEDRWKNQLGSLQRCLSHLGIFHD